MTRRFASRLDVLVGFLALVGAASESLAQSAAELALIRVPRDETSTPPDHLMASQCLAELRARDLADAHRASSIAFSRSAVLGQVVRIEYRVVGEEGPAASAPHHLVCLRRDGDTGLDVYVFPVSASPAAEPPGER